MPPTRPRCAANANALVAVSAVCLLSAMRQVSLPYVLGKPVGIGLEA